MSDTGPTVAVPRRRRWPWVLLVVSLALNALLVGVVMRGLWIARANLVMAGGNIETSLPAFVQSLPAARREELRRANLPEQPDELRPLRVELRRARAETTRLFLADPFDKVAYVAAQERLLEAESKLRGRIFALLPELGERLTAAERRAYLRAHGGGWRRGGWRREHGGDRRGYGGDAKEP